MLVVALALALRPVSIEGSAQCPSPAALARALANMLPDAKISDGDGALVVRVDDLGARFRLRVGDEMRELPDAARKCDERARQAAVVVALALAPPSVDEAPTAEAPPPTPEAAAPPPSEAEVRAPIEERVVPTVTRRRVELELGAGLDVAPLADGGALAQGAIGIRFVIGRPRIAMTLGVAATTPTTMELLPARVQVTRIPIDLSARYVANAGRRIEATFDLGGIADVLLLEGQPGLGGNRVSAGVRVAASARWWVRDETAFFAGAEAVVLPNTYALVVDDGSMTRSEGHTPDAWLSISMGCVVGMR